MRYRGSAYRISARLSIAAGRSLPEFGSLRTQKLGLVRILMPVLMIGTAAHAQLAAPAFEVTSVKPHNPKVAVFSPSCPNGRLISAGPIYWLILWAYNLAFPQSAELEEQLPGWAKHGDYDVEAKSEGPVSEAQCRLMLQSLLAERFKFAWHRETREGNVYDLVVAPGGRKLQRVADTDTEQGVNITINGRPLSRLPGTPVRKGTSMANFAGSLSALNPDRLPVIDKTGLEGEFKINLAFSGDPLQFSDPDLETALQKQLGLKLVRHKGPVEHFVLDHIERPDPN